MNDIRIRRRRDINDIGAAQCIRFAGRQLQRIGVTTNFDHIVGTSVVETANGDLTVSVINNGIACLQRMGRAEINTVGLIIDLSCARRTQIQFKTVPHNSAGDRCLNDIDSDGCAGPSTPCLVVFTVLGLFLPGNTKRTSHAQDERLVTRIQLDIATGAHDIIFSDTFTRNLDTGVSANYIKGKRNRRS